MSLWLVTGGAGFIGSAIVAELLGRGQRVRVLDDFSTGHREALEGLVGPLEVVEGDVRDPGAVARAVEGASHVLHQAALPSVARSLADPVTTNDVNVRGTLGVLWASRNAGVRRFVYASSSSVYGDAPVMPRTEDMAPRPISPYAVSKLAGELYALVLARILGLPVVVLRYFNVFGPGQDPESPYAAVIPRFLSAALAGRPPIVHGDGRQSRDFTFVANVVSANLLACEQEGCTGQVFNIATGHSVSLLTLLEHVGRLAGRRIDPVFEPARPGDVPHSEASLSRARRVLGYEPRIGLAEGLERTWAWYRRQAAAGGGS